MGSTQKYRVQSVKTKYYLVTDDAKKDAVLETKNGATSVPANSILTFSSPVHDKPVIVTIAGPDGLYVTLPEDAVENTKLTWTKTAYEWEVEPTIDSDKHITYQLNPANGKDFYMFDNFTIGAYIVAKPGAHIVPPESFFALTTA